jgi:uracil-DNA glycosylase
MPSPTLTRFLKSLQSETGPDVFNPWTDHDPTTDISRHAPRDRLARLTTHLSINPRYVLIGEAPGYQGCKVTGVPFTSERLILECQIPRISTTAPRLTSRPRPWSEPSATIVWKALHALGIAQETILWNAFPWHPHKPKRLHSNRTPTRDERTTGLPIIRNLLALYPTARLFAVGRNAEASLGELGIAATLLRHPARGGATQFARQLRNAVA